MDSRKTISKDEAYDGIDYFYSTQGSSLINETQEIAFGGERLIYTQTPRVMLIGYGRPILNLIS